MLALAGLVAALERQRDAHVRNNRCGACGEMVGPGRESLHPAHFPCGDAARALAAFRNAPPWHEDRELRAVVFGALVPAATRASGSSITTDVLAALDREARGARSQR